MKNKLKINSLISQQIENKAMRMVVGGDQEQCICICGCQGPSSTNNNGNANNSSGKATITGGIEF